MTCLITGCVATTDGVRWVGGDLHAVGGCLVFNAIVDEEGDPRLGPRDEWAHYNKECDFSQAASAYIKRGVFIAPSREVRLNPCALNYIARNEGVGLRKSWEHRRGK